MAEHSITHTVGEQHDGLPGRTILTHELGISRQLMTRIKRSGEFYVNGQPSLLKDRVYSGDKLLIVIREEKTQDIPPEDIPLSVVFEDEHLLIVDKPPGMVVHPTKGYLSQTLANAVIHYWQQRGENCIFRPVHRLDRDTTGLVIIAKNPYVQESLTSQHADGRWQKTYTAVVEGYVETESGTIDAPILRVGLGTRRRVISDLGQSAQTLWRVLHRWRGASMLEAVLVTGRTHQIRAHFAHMGHPILGDDIYGSSSPLMARQALHAGHLSFVHPVTKLPLTFTCPLPTDMSELIQGLNVQQW